MFLIKSTVAMFITVVMIVGTMPFSLLSADSIDPQLCGKTAFELTSEMKLGWNLGNTLESHVDSYTIDTPPKKFATAWGNPEPTAELFKAVADGGFNTVRIPVTWYQHITFDEAADTYVIDEKWLEYVKKTIDYAYLQELFVILNVHHEDWVNVPEFTENSLKTASEITADIWSQLADTFSDYDQHLVFEALNEPRQTGLGHDIEWGNGDESSRTYINTLNGIFVDTVRSQESPQNKERLLMLPGYCANCSYEVLSAVEIPENDDHIALSAHAYKPYFFTADTKYGNHDFAGGDPWGNDYEAELVKLFDDFGRVIKEKNVPIVIGEFGASDFSNDRTEWAMSYISKADALGIPCVLWDNNKQGGNSDSSSAYGCLYRLTNTWYTSAIPMIEAMLDVYGIKGKLPEYREYIPPQFSWENIDIEENWIPMYYAENGTQIEPWKSIKVSDWRDCITPKYELVLVYDSVKEPFMVLQGGWYKVQAEDERDSRFVKHFSYTDFECVAEENNTTISDIKSLYIGASSAEMTVYGLYAVPVQSTSAGDVNGDGEVNVADAVMLQRWLLGSEMLSDWRAGDLCSDGVIDVFDMVMMRKLLITTNAKKMPKILIDS